jgi:hypothetical protein
MKLNSNEIRYIQDQANNRITELLDILGIQYTERHDYIQMACPIHSGDNERGLYWAFRTNHFSCQTRHCEENGITGKSSSIIGLVRGIMSTREDRSWSFIQTVMFIAKILNITQIKLDPETQQDIEINKILQQYRAKKDKIVNNKEYLLLRDVLPSLKSDTIYYPKRGVSQNIINKYYISYCDDKNKRFYKRAFFPVLDDTGKFVVGWSARSIYSSCKECKMYHNPEINCPDKKYKGLYPKWLHSLNFHSEQFLYNYWSAKRFISKTGTAIICESPGNVWALESVDINNSVALMGLSLSKTQRLLLQKAGALTLIIILDNDKAGKDAKQRLEDSLGYYFRLIFIYPENVNDVAEMLPQEIKEKIGKILKSSSKELLLKE